LLTFLLEGGTMKNVVTNGKKSTLKSKQ